MLTTLGSLLQLSSVHLSDSSSVNSDSFRNIYRCLLELIFVFAYDKVYPKTEGDHFSARGARIIPVMERSRSDKSEYMREKSSVNVAAIQEAR